MTKYFPAPAGCGNYSSDVEEVACLTFDNFLSYAANISANVFVGRYEYLRKWVLRYRDIRPWYEGHASFGLKRDIQIKAGVTSWETLLSDAFRAYLIWMTSREFIYTPSQTAPNIFINMQAGDGFLPQSAYSIFWDPELVRRQSRGGTTYDWSPPAGAVQGKWTPTGNCTVVNMGFLYICMCLGVPRTRLMCTSVAADDDPENPKYVMQVPSARLEAMKAAGDVDTSNADYLHLNRYKTKMLVLKPNSNVVELKPRETPFPNHQYAHVDMPSLRFKWFDARNGYRYSTPMGIYEFWGKTADIVYVAPDGETVTAQYLEKIGGASLSNYVVEVPERCWRSLARVRGEMPQRGALDVSGWFYVEDNAYGPRDHRVQVVGAGRKMSLPADLAKVFGYFIQDGPTQDLVRRIKLVVDDYQERLDFNPGLYQDARDRAAHAMLSNILLLQGQVEVRLDGTASDVDFGIGAERTKTVDFDKAMTSLSQKRQALVQSEGLVALGPVPSTRTAILDFIYDLLGMLPGDGARRLKTNLLWNLLVRHFEMPTFLSGL